MFLRLPYHRIIPAGNSNEFFFIFPMHLTVGGNVLDAGCGSFPAEVNPLHARLPHAPVADTL
jgi:hypothetical protein